MGGKPLMTVGAGPDDVEDGTYDLTCTGVEAKVFPGQVNQYNPEGKDSPVFVWHFTFTGSDQEIDGVTSQMTGPKAKASGWIAALLGPQALQPGASYEASDFIGKRALGRTEHNNKGYPRVADLFPLPKQAQTAQPQPSVAGPQAVDPALVVEGAVQAQQQNPTIRAQAGEGDDLPF